MSSLKSITALNGPPAAGPYCHAVVTSGMVFCSGQIPVDKDGNVVEGDIQAHTKQCLKNLAIVLQASGSDLNHVAKVTIFLADMGDFAKVNETYAEIFGSHKPARACVAVKTLPKNVDVEIECIAVVAQ
ncbi:2-iminobutanoate/2-iminopropanoate deaminase [Neolecta irregularis DAH-3]|uniref:2-iminobutanoate/2-iminopropanoate deaminase n=1 Tax=Neolecta irregularis (strain DAH-3) TaxID=1198029 RepID=A0A1U7LL25_NEOID|nr:2-iminobutanoate/2-iminopropanoate deaminase [Neolecta irregularis DAH-3]|eukprot:OLL23293.1 2-iminobutanoate/2-iminopropanoate deaminase [Neolecta irregularis DAH-3]